MGVIRRTSQLLRADFFAFRFISDFRARQHIDSIDQFFPDCNLKRNGYFSETKCPPETRGETAGGVAVNCTFKQ